MVTQASSWRYLPLTTANSCSPDPTSLFEAMKDDLLADGDVERAMHKAFRWGYEDEDGEHVDGLRDMMQRLRDEREELAAGDGETSTRDQDNLEHDGATEMADDTGEGERLDVEGRVQQIQEMERTLRQIESIDDLQNLDPQLVNETLTEDEREWIEQWMSMTGQLIESGLVVEGTKRLELSPEAIRRIGAHALRSMYVEPAMEAAGEHELRRKGLRGPTTDTSSAWEFGQPFSLHLSRTIMNAISRQGAGSPLSLTPDDFEVFDRESTSASATVLLIDMSRSMFHNGCWDAAKRSALALDTLMRSRYPRDFLEIVGFSGTAERLNLMQLPSLSWDEFSHGTNLQAGLSLSRELLHHHRSMNRQVIIITDGEPTAFTEKGEVFFENPATERTFEVTLREVVRCTRERIGITTFLLDRSPELQEFVSRMTRINRGRIIQSAPDQLGRYLVRDFARHHTSIVG
jgi:uncharacterized protein with von Willebrand factor type A (vWA) domain